MMWVITGNKYWCTFADGADYIQLLARAEGSDDPALKGLKNFIIGKGARQPAGGLFRIAHPQDRLLRLEHL